MPASEDLTPQPITRRTLLRATTVAAAAAAGGMGLVSPAAARSARTTGAGSLFAELDDKIRAVMDQYVIPGVAVGVLHRGREYVRGYGVANVDTRAPVDGDTAFRIGSTTKTFTGTTIMRLVEQGRIDLDAPVRRYLPELRTSDPSVARRVTVRQLLDHSAGWLGEYYQHMGDGDDALARYVDGIGRLPQLTAPGTVFAYNNASVALSARIIEVVTGQTYESAARRLLIDPLGLRHTRYFVDELAGVTVAAAHGVVDGRPVVAPDFYPRSINATGGLFSTARDQLRYARFHLGDGTTPEGRRLLARRSLTAMRSQPGPGGTLVVELDGMGVTWMLRPSAEGVRVVQHGGSWAGQYSGFLMVPDRGFVITVLTNSDGGLNLIGELFTDDWALRRFAGVRNLPARPRPLAEGELAAYQGRYSVETIDVNGNYLRDGFDVAAADGQLVVTAEGAVALRLAFSVRDQVLVPGRTDGTAAADRPGRQPLFLRHEQNRDGCLEAYDVVTHAAVEPGVEATPVVRAKDHEVGAVDGRGLQDGTGDVGVHGVDDLPSRLDAGRGQVLHCGGHDRMRLRVTLDIDAGVEGGLLRVDVQDTDARPLGPGETRGGREDGERPVGAIDGGQDVMEHDGLLGMGNCHRPVAAGTGSGAAAGL